MGKIIFKKEGVTADVAPETKVLKAAIDHFIVLNTYVALHAAERVSSR